MCLNQLLEKPYLNVSWVTKVINYLLKIKYKLKNQV